MKNVIKLYLVLLLIFVSGCSNNQAPPSTFSIIDVPMTIDGNSVKVTEYDYRGYNSIVSVFNDLITAQRISDISVQFQYDLSTEDVDIITANGANATQSNSEMILQSGTSLNGDVQATSVESLRYRPGHEAFAIFTSAWVTGGVNGAKQYAGIVNEDEDGYYLGFNNTNFVVGIIKTGVIEEINQSDWNGNYKSLGCTLNTSSLNIYRISFGWLGVAPITFEHYCGLESGWVILHQIDKTGQTITPTIDNPVLPIHFHIEKTNSATNLEMRTASWNAGSINSGDEDVGKRYFTANGNKTISTGLNNLLTIRSNYTFYGKSNRVENHLQYISASSDGNKNVRLGIYKNCDLTGANFIKLDDDSTIYTDTSATLSNCEELIMLFQLEKVGALNEFLREMDIHLHRNETISITATSATNNEVSATLRWEELF